MSVGRLHFRDPKFVFSSAAEMTRVFCTPRRACTDKAAGAPLVNENRRSDSTWLQTLLVCLITVSSSVPQPDVVIRTEPISQAACTSQESKEYIKKHVAAALWQKPPLKTNFQ